MPHYRDGAEAKLGDLVRGKPYNTPREVVGTVIGLVPAAENCNLRVAWLTASKEPPPVSGIAPLIACNVASEESRCFLKVEYDYGATKDFELIAPGA